MVWGTLFTCRWKTVLHSMQVRAEFMFVSRIEKGRGIFGTGSSNNGNRTEGRAGRYDKIETSGTGPCPCIPLRNPWNIAIEGWIIFLTNIHEEAQEEDLLDVCAEYGTVKNFHMNVDRRTGFIKVLSLPFLDRRATLWWSMRPSKTLKMPLKTWKVARFWVSKSTPTGPLLKTRVLVSVFVDEKTAATTTWALQFPPFIPQPPPYRSCGAFWPHVPRH